MRKGYLTPPVILVLAVITLFVAGAIYLNSVLFSGKAKPTSSPTPSPIVNETANWKTYTNRKVGFQIKYPSSKNVPYVVQGMYGGQPNDVNGMEDNEVIDFPIDNSDLAIAFTLELFPFSGSLDDITKLPANERKFSYGGIDNPISLEKEFLIDGFKTIWNKRTAEQDQTKNVYEIFLVAKNHAFIFNTTPAIDEKLINQILSTFKFLD